MNPLYFGRNVFILLLVIFNLGNSAKILAVFPSPGYSQYILAESLLVALAERGHNVTVISGFETKNVTNLTNILVNVKEEGDELTDAIFELGELSIYDNLKFSHEFTLAAIEKVLSDEKVQALIHSDETFDLVLVETFFDEALQTLATHFKAHQVLFHSAAISSWNSHFVGNPSLPSYLPDAFTKYTNRMNFRERLRNTLALWLEYIHRYFVRHPVQQKLIDRYFPGKYNLDDFIYNASLILTCSHVATAEPLPLTSSVIEVGGLHIKSGRQLPKDIREFLDSAKDGAIFFSMGSNVKSSDFPKQVIREILLTIGKLKQKVLWKFEDTKLENKPDNLMISKWFPQSDILGHNNTILFISHGGLGSTTESIYYGVPVLGIPIFFDQFVNMRRLVLFGMGLELSFKELSEKTLESSIREILDNPKYAYNAKRRSSIMKDRPMKPLDLAVYWIEYVLRHDGAHHLKSAILELTWYQLYLCDVIGFLLVLLIGICFSIFVGLRFLVRYLTTKEKTD